MKSKICFLLSLLIIGCMTPQHGKVLDLIKRLPYAEKSDNLQVIPFGRPEGKQFLLSGWAEPERDGNDTFQRAASNKAVFFFNTSSVEPLFLHMKLSSSPATSAEVLLNKKPVGSIRINGEPDVYSMRLPSDVVLANTNVVELDWNNTPAKPAAYFAVVTPAKYLTGNPVLPVRITSGAQLLDINGKNRQTITFPEGGTIRYYEKLNKDSNLEFGIYYKPPALSEDDDFADFSVTLRQDGKPEQRIFQKHVTTYIVQNEKILLSKYLTSNEPQIYEIEFKLQRNSILDSGNAAWVEPFLYQGFSPKEQPSASTIEKVRQANNGANVIIIILDAAGAKHFPMYGYHRDTTPNIKNLLNDSIQFERAYTQAVYTLAATATLMSGLDPFRHQIIYRRNKLVLKESKLPNETFTLAERFLNSGYATGTFVSNGNASSTFGMTQGFQEVREVFREKTYTGWGMDITNRFTQWLQSLKAGRPFFAYIHYREPHAPFNPPESFKNHFTDPNYTGYKDASYEMRRKINMGEISSTQADRDYIEATYDENLRYGDYEVGRVIKKLKDMKVYDKTILIITADHGEAFWEHNFQGHNSQLYEESVHIPLIVKLSSKTELNKKKVKNPVRTIDLYPTLVDLLELSRRNWNVDGHSFIPYLVSDKLDDVPVFTQTISEQGYSWMEGNFKYIYHRHASEELYNLKTDPEERNNLIKTDTVQAGYLRSRLFGWHAEKNATGSRLKTDRAVMDESTRENLKALGYIDE
ncbi:sulfatase [bacterium]|nr:sulfatase [bacterium]